jgi:DNA repair protein RecO (recombination protein O)
MDFQEEAFVLSARAHGDTGAVVDLLTEHHGRRAAYVAGGASRKMRPFLQPGARVVADYRARTSDHLGGARLEPVGEGPSALFDDALALTGLAAAAGVAQGALPEREPHPGVFLAFEALMAAFALADVWPAIFVRFEAGLLEDLGFGLDLSKCAATGTAYADKMLNLPPFMLGAQAGLAAGDVKAGFDLTGHFLEQFVFHPQNKPLPPARAWMLNKLAEAGRL